MLAVNGIVLLKHLLDQTADTCMALYCPLLQDELHRPISFYVVYELLVFIYMLLSICTIVQHNCYNYHVPLVHLQVLAFMYGAALCFWSICLLQYFVGSSSSLRMRAYVGLRLMQSFRNLRCYLCFPLLLCNCCKFALLAARLQSSESIVNGMSVEINE